MQQQTVRLHSIDAFRAVTMFLMIFVNDVDSVSNIPEWIKHAELNPDRLGFADTIFPAFLFIVGLSLPFAVRNRKRKGDTNYQLAIYIATRSFALLVMGFFHVNLENYNKAAILPKAVWEIAITISFFLIWLDYPGSLPITKKRTFQIAGIVLLALMAFLYKGGTLEEPAGLQPYWGGILGLIGWSYLICATLLLLFGERLPLLLAALVFLLFFNVITNTDRFPFFSSLHSYIHIVGNGSMPAFTMAGVIISLILTRFLGKGKEAVLWTLLLSSAIIMTVFGFATRPFGGISKIYATPSWVGICTGIAIVAFAVILYVVDYKGKKNIFALIKTAGTSTLTCYLIPYLLYSVYSLTHFKFPAVLSSGAGGIIRSLATAFAVILIARFLEKRRIRLSI